VEAMNAISPDDLKDIYAAFAARKWPVDIRMDLAKKSFDRLKKEV
jgi:hypothetical protein